MNGSVALINPALLVQRDDPMTTGIVYMPFGLAYIAAVLRQSDISIKVIDGFGEAPYQAKQKEKFLNLGLEPEEIIAKIPADSGVVIIYAINLTNHNASAAVIQAIRAINSEIKIIVLENTQAVTSYALEAVAGEFYELGADYILTGESERRVVELVTFLLSSPVDYEQIKSLAGVGSPEFYNPPTEPSKDLDSLPFPAWDLFPIENYWKLHFAHGPQTSNKYLPLLTSRGCPFQCRFCVVPATNHRRWRSRSAVNVVDEMEFFFNKYGVSEFHFEDLDPTVSDQRIRDICLEIGKRGLNITWKLVSGTKVETIRTEDTIDMMARAGCRYISISPETGSPRVLKLMNKPFDLEHAVKLINRMNINNIHSQACFVLGFPGETTEDLKMTWKLVHDLTRNGVDEIALFIITPVPGSEIYKEFEGYHSLSEMNFSPTWRSDYRTLAQFRLRLYISFLFWKLRYHPLKILKQPFNFLSRHFETKMEMIPFRALVVKLLEIKTIF